MRILILLIPLLAALTPEGVLVRGPKMHIKQTPSIKHEVNPMSAPIKSTPPRKSQTIVEDIDFGEDFDIYDIINPGGRK